MGESSFFLNKRGVYEKVMCNRPCGFYKYKNSGKVCFFLWREFERCLKKIREENGGDFVIIGFRQAYV